MRVAVSGIGTALPPGRVTQAAARDAVEQWLGPGEVRAAWLRRVFDRAGVAERRSVLLGISGAEAPFGGDRRPGTARRMAIYREHAGPLAAEACRRALASAEVAPADVTHLVVVSCTGFHAPGVDAELLDALGLSPDVDRAVVGFMGCYGAFAGMRVARRAVEADPRAVALVVSVELCSIHVRADAAPASLVAHALFGDGAAAVVLTSGAAPTLFDLGPAASRIEPGTGAMMGWTIGDDGFEMTLANEVPERLRDALPRFAASLRGDDAPRAWCVHPGGPAILVAAEKALALPAGALDDARAVLRDVGNVSSATILFVLERAAARLGAGTPGLALGFGPGLTIEGFAFRRGARAAARDAAPVPAEAAV